MILLILALTPRCLVSLSQTPGTADRTEITLGDQTRVVLVKDDTRESGFYPWYYLPLNLRISFREETPEFSFLAYDSDEDGLVDGAVMHMLLTWGLTNRQTEEAESLLKEKQDTAAFIAGAVLLHPGNREDNFRIHSDNPLAAILRHSLKSKGSIPFSPGEKMALSFMFSAGDARKMEEALKNPVTLKGIYFEIIAELSEGGRLQPFLLRGNFQHWMNDLRREEEIR